MQLDNDLKLCTYYNKMSIVINECQCTKYTALSTQYWVSSPKGDNSVIQEIGESLSVLKRERGNEFIIRSVYRKEHRWCPRQLIQKHYGVTPCEAKHH